MSTLEIATRLVAHCRQGDYIGAQRALYADDVLSIEPAGRPATRGLSAIHAKTEEFERRFEIHRNTISDPVVAGSFFGCAMTLDVTERQSGRQITLTEICVYEVKDERIVREQFFYDAPPGT